MSKLSVRDVSKAYPNGEDGETKVLDNISFEVGEKEFLSILGPSGCGKTTLLKIIAGLMEPDSGTILIDNKEETLEPGFRKSLVNEMISLVGIEGLDDHYPHEISGGQARKTEMARSLVTSPDVLASDEGFSILDAQTRNYIQEEFLRVWEETGSTILFVTHNVDEAVFMSDRILVMSNVPAKIIAEYEVDLPRPRERASSESREFRAKILEVLKAEQEKALQIQ